MENKRHGDTMMLMVKIDRLWTSPERKRKANATREKGDGYHGKRRYLVNHLTVQLDLTNQALRQHVPVLLTPFHEGKLNGLVTVNGDKISIFITVT